MRGLYKLYRWMAEWCAPTTRDCLEKNDERLNKFLNGQYCKDARPTM